MNEFFTTETPNKVLALLGASLLSMAFLFSVSVSNASFRGTETALINPFEPNKVVAVIDSFAKSYSDSIVKISEPAQYALALHFAEIKWVADESGLSSIFQGNSLATEQIAKESKVAGASISDSYIEENNAYQPISVDTILQALIGN